MRYNFLLYSLNKIDFLILYDILKIIDKYYKNLHLFSKFKFFILYDN